MGDDEHRSGQILGQASDYSLERLEAAR